MARLLHVQSRPNYKPFCAAIVFDDERDRVIEASRSIEWMRGWTINQVSIYCEKHNWQVDRRGEKLE